jgi:drug/metabolite transporter (DMT)-like permease
MDRDKLVGLVFAILTALFWGFYGPALLKSRLPSGTPGDSPFKAFVFIGIAYLIWGVFGGLLGVVKTGGTLSFTSQTITWGLIAGSLGAFGALTLTYANYSAKDASLVMPVVFGGATMVSVLAAFAFAGKKVNLHPLQLLGFVMVVIGVVLIQRFTAHGPAPAKHAGGQTQDESIQQRLKT